MIVTHLILKRLRENIIKNLSKNGFVNGKDYIIQLVPNITNITYGRKVGYKIEEEVFDEKIHSISATNIRKNGIKLILNLIYKH